MSSDRHWNKIPKQHSSDNKCLFEQIFPHQASIDYTFTCIQLPWLPDIFYWVIKPSLSFCHSACSFNHATTMLVNNLLRVFPWMSKVVSNSCCLYRKCRDNWINIQWAIAKGEFIRQSHTRSQALVVVHLYISLTARLGWVKKLNTRVRQSGHRRKETWVISIIFNLIFTRSKIRCIIMLIVLA